MQVSVEETSELGRKITITIPSDKVEKEVNQRLNGLKGRVKIDGFRPGKVPLNVVRQRYGAQVNQEVMADEMQASYRDAVLQEKLRPASSPSIEPQNIEKGQDITFVALFDVFPDFKLCDFSKLEVTVPTSEVEDKDVDLTLERVRKQRMQWNEVDGACKNEQRITLDFVGKLDGKEFEGGKAEDFPLVMGDGGMIAGFEDNLLGLKAGENKSFAVTFPEDYGNSELAGKEATFDVIIKKVEEGELPEIDDEFISSFGVDGSIDELKAEIRKSLEGELQQQLNVKSKEAVMQVLLDNNELSLPESMVSQEVAALRKQALENFKMETDSELPDNLFEEEAKRRVKLGLVIGEIVSEQKLQVDTQLVNQRIQQLASQYADREQVIQYYSTNNQARASVESLVMEDQVVEWIMGQVIKKENKESFDSIVKQRQ
ncbi:MAG: trigger factor [Gammaproteobacteria bacterium]|nr:trigger factor [Gammaproteobacteria bacterium]